MIAMVEDHYPETLKMSFIINGKYISSNMIVF
jgi:hypothetical protein